MEYKFIVSDEGLVEVALTDELFYMGHALEDSLGTRPPRGASQDGPSTYWIDTTLMHLNSRLADGGEDAIASGNITYLIVRDGFVQARLDVDSVEDDNYDAVSVKEFLILLNAWRTAVMAESPAADRRMPPPRPARANGTGARMKTWSTAAQSARSFFVWRCYVMNFRTVLLIAVYGVFMTGILVRDLWRASYGDALLLTIPIGGALLYFLWPLIWRTLSRRLLGRKEEYPWRSSSRRVHQCRPQV